MSKPEIPSSIEDWNARTRGTLPGLIGVEFLDVGARRVAARLSIRSELLAPNGFLHAATVIAVADTACGYGTLAGLPQGATGFTTVELKSNFLGTALDGTIECVATLAHGGRTTQVWDASVTHVERARTIALFRCTQLILSASAAAGRS